MSAADRLEPFATRAQQHHADRLGMMVFLASEIMLFGGLFAALIAYRLLHPGAAAQASAQFELWLGTANTAILLTSSLFVGLGVEAAKRGSRAAAGWLALAAVSGLAFLAVKGCEYRLEYLHGLVPTVTAGAPLAGRPARLFVSLYYVSTGLHAVHVSIGVAMLAATAAGIGRRRLALPQRAGTVELVGLYWHLVDAIWVFLFPLLYLARP